MNPWVIGFLIVLAILLIVFICRLSGGADMAEDIVDIFLGDD